jgi:hypothetical protein
MSAKIIAIDSNVKQGSRRWSQAESVQENPTRVGRSPVKSAGSLILSSAKLSRDSARASWRKRMAALKPRTRLYFMFACVQAVMLASWLLASFAQAKGTLFDFELLSGNTVT